MRDRRNGRGAFGPGRLRVLFALGLACLAAGGAARGAGLSYGEIEISPEVEPRGILKHGYTEYRFQVKNRGQGAARVTLQIPGDSDNRRGIGSLTSITRSVEVAPGGVTSVSLLQPATPDLGGTGMAVYVNGRKQEQLFPVSLVSGQAPPSHMMYSRRRGRGVYTSHGYGYGGAPANEVTLLTSSRVPENFFKVEQIAPVGAVPFGGGGMIVPAPGGPPGKVGMMGGGGPGLTTTGPPFPMQLMRSDLPVSIWNSDWLAYSRYDGIVVTAEDLEELQRGGAETQAVLQALWQYVETGGVLVALGRPNGKGRLPLPASHARSPREENGLLLYSVGFGICTVSPDRDSSTWVANGRWQTLLTRFSETSRAGQNANRNLIEHNTAFPVVADLGLPIKGLFALMVLFGIAMGPVNLVLLARYRRRIWLLWTVPALALVFCLAVLGYMIVAEGWQGHTRVAGLTLLDEVEKRATTLGRSAFYSPLTPGDGLRFGTSTEVQLLGEGHSAWSNSCTIHWGDDQHLARGWISARIPSYFALRKSESLRRERLTLRRESDGALTVVNALGVEIEQLWLADEEGRLHRAASIPAGSSARLEKDGRKVGATLPDAAWRQAYVNYSNVDWVTTVQNMRGEPEKYLRPGTYLAVVASSPFLEPGLKNASVRPAESVVLGIMADPAGKR